MGTSPAKHNLATLMAATGILLVAAIYFLRLDRVAGLMVDDAWYLVLAQALANGEGYRVVSSATVPILPPTPPGFPLVMSLFLRFGPPFPANVLLIKIVSVAACAALAVVTWRYARLRGLPPVVGGGAAVATVLTPALVFLATSTLMAECVFTLTQLLTIVAIERAVRTDARHSRTWTTAAALFAAGSVLLRTPGGVVAAAALVYILVRRRISLAVVYTVVLAAVLAPWLLYARAHEPTVAERQANGGGFAFAYSEMMRLRIGGTPSSGRATNAELVERVAYNAFNVTARDIGGIAAAALYRTPEESGEEVAALGGRIGLHSGSMGNAVGTIAFSIVVSAITLVGFVTACRERLTAAEIFVTAAFALIVAIPFWTFRYVVPLAPFLFIYLARGLKVLAARTADPWRPARIALLCVVGLDVVDHARYIAAARSSDATVRVDWLADARESEEVFEWMRRNLAEPGYVASTNPGLVYMMTGRKALALEYDAERWAFWKRIGVRYLVSLAPVELPPSTYAYTLKYQTARRKYWVVEI